MPIRHGFLALYALAACAESDAEPPLPPPGDAIVRFELADGPMAIADVPWPSDLYRDVDGRIAFGAIPNPMSEGSMLTASRALLSQRAGFCTTCNIVFAIDGGLALDNLHVAEPSPTLDDAVVLVDVDPESPELGRTFPLRWQWDETSGWLSIRPARGFTLAGNRRYAAVITDAARGGDGLPIGPAPAFEILRDDPGGDPAGDVLEPALGELERLGLRRARVRGLAAFTTDEPTSDLRTIRAVVEASAPAVARIDRVFTAAALDELLGIPAEPRPGVDVPPADGTEGTSAVRHDTTLAVVTGWFAAPRFVAGSGSEVGANTRDTSGRPYAQRYEDVPFLLIVPRDVDLTRVPVVVAHHGFNASRTTGFVLADTAGRAGFAVFAIDAYQHGARAASATDEEHAMRGGLPGPDGFAETVALDVSARVFGLIAPDPAMTLYPGYSLAAFEQFAADVMAAVRFVAAGDHDVLREAHPALAALAFDPDRIAFVGNSMGAVVGTSIAAVEPRVRAVVLDVLPGSIIETLAESGEFRPLTETLLLPRVGVTGPFDEIEHAMLFDPTVDLFRWVLEPIDPLALARRLVQERIDGTPPHFLVQLAGHDEVAAPPASESVVAAAGLPTYGDLQFVAAPPASLPISGEPAIAAVRFDGAMHGMLEVVHQSSRYAAPLDVPLTLLDIPAAVVNPTEAVHAQIEAFLGSFGRGGPVVIQP